MRMPSIKSTLSAVFALASAFVVTPIGGATPYAAPKEEFSAPVMAPVARADLSAAGLAQLRKPFLAALQASPALQQKIDAIGNRLDAPTHAAVDRCVADAIGSSLYRDAAASYPEAKTAALTALSAACMSRSIDATIAQLQNDLAQAQKNLWSRHAAGSKSERAAALKQAKATLAAHMHERIEKIGAISGLFTTLAATPRDQTLTAAMLTQLSSAKSVATADSFDNIMMRSYMNAGEIEQMLDATAAETGMKYPRLLKAVALNESGMGKNVDGRDARGRIVSRGLMQVTASTEWIILDRHNDQLKTLLSQPKYGKRFEAVVNYLNGDTSKATKAAVARKIYDPQLSAYLGSFYLQDVGGNHSPAMAYMYYVSPKMADAIRQEPRNSTVTAKELADANGIAAAVVANNPSIYGVDGQWDVKTILAKNDARFIGVVPKAPEKPRIAPAAAKTHAPAAAAKGAKPDYGAYQAAAHQVATGAYKLSYVMPQQPAQTYSVKIIHAGQRIG